jgi:hypothetical protein
MGVITYFLLAGYTPFDRDSQQEEMEAIIAGVCVIVSSVQDEPSLKAWSYLLCST